MLKKSLSFVVAIASVFSVSASAFALDVTDDDELTLVDEEVAAEMDILARNIWSPNFCGYRLKFREFGQPNQAVFCDAIEILAVDVASCSDAYRLDFETSIIAGDLAGTQCEIIDSIGDKLCVTLALLAENNNDVDRLFGNVLTDDGEQHELEVLD